MLRAWGALLVAACRTAAPQAHPQPTAIAPVHAPDAAITIDAPAAAAGLITDDECEKRGGHVVTEQTYEHLRRSRAPDEKVTPFRACHYDSPKNGAACGGDGECAGGRCYCTGALARPSPGNDPALQKLDGKPAIGACSDKALPDGEWFCLVEGGKARLQGVIVD